MALADMKKHELMALCKEWAIEGVDGKTKAELIALLEADDRDIPADSKPGDGGVEQELAEEIIPSPDMSGFDMAMEGDEEFLVALFPHVMKREATMGDLNHYKLMLSSGIRDRAGVVLDLERSAEYRLANCE